MEQGGKALYTILNYLVEQINYNTIRHSFLVRPFGGRTELESYHRGKPRLP